MKKIFIVILSIALFFTGCENIDFGDTNENVNGPTEANTATLLSGAMTNFATRAGRPYRITPTLNVQYLLQLVYNDEMLYANTPGYWTSYYVQVLSNLQAVINMCEADDAELVPAIVQAGDLDNQVAVALIFKSVVMKRVTDLFGDAPYSDALNPDTYTPMYDSQEDIYAGMIADVTKARGLINSGAGPVGDAIYGGDMAAWSKFANSFLLGLSLQLSEVASTTIDYEAVFADAIADPGGLIETLGDEAIYTYYSYNGFDNPWSWMRAADYGVTSEVIHSLKGAGDFKVTSNTTFDNRLQYFVRNGDYSGDGEPYGHYDTGSGNNVRINYTVIGTDVDLPLLTAGYVYLHRAEGAQRGWSTEDVDDMLEAGIKASHNTFHKLYSSDLYDENGYAVEDVDSWFVADSARDAYATARLADVATAAGGAIQVIAEEKWVALFPLGYDAWAEWRRTDYPVLTPAVDAINNGEIPRRYNYPSDEASLNATNYAVGVANLIPAEDANHSRVWWDQ